MQPASAAIQLSTRSSLAALEASLQVFRELRAEMPIQLPLMFLLIAQHKSITASRLGKLTGLSQSAVSRNISALTKEGKAKEPGLGLVVKTLDPANPRAHAIRLTKEGRAMSARLAAVLGAAIRPHGRATGSMLISGQEEELSPAVEAPDAFAGAHWEVWVD